jgi:hypothetical protein
MRVGIPAFPYWVASTALGSSWRSQLLSPAQLWNVSQATALRTIKLSGGMVQGFLLFPHDTAAT